MSVNPKEVAAAWLARYASALSAANVPETVSWLRDIQVITWDKPPKIPSYLANTLSSLTFRIDGLFAAFTFETPIAHGRDAVRLFLDSSSEWKALTVFMTVSDLKGHEVLGYESGIYEGHTAAWSDVMAKRQQQTEDDPNVVVVDRDHTSLECHYAAQADGY